MTFVLKEMHEAEKANGMMEDIGTKAKREELQRWHFNSKESGGI